MNLLQLLENNKDELILEANGALTCKALKSYKKSGKEINKTRLKSLYESILESVEKNNLLIVIQYAEKIANERFKSGYEIYEVQSAFNALEEVIWQKIVQNMESTNVAEALRYISTVLGAGKESLANSYVKFARNAKASAIDHSALFEGTDGA